MGNSGVDSYTLINYCQALLWDQPICTCIKMSAILLSDNNTTEPLSDCVEVTDVVQSVRNYITDVLL